MFKASLFAAAATLTLTAPAAVAATLVFNGTGQTYDVSNNDIDAAFNTELDIITGDQNTTQTGLFLDMEGADEVLVRYTYLGSEAENINYSVVVGVGRFNNHTVRNTAEVGDWLEQSVYHDGMLRFAFGTGAPRIHEARFDNHGVTRPPSEDIALAFSRIDNDSFYVLFDDIGGGDRDFDDMAMRIDVTAVPLPAGILLLLTALGGLGFMRSRQLVA